MIVPAAGGRKSAMVKVRVNEHNKIMLDGKHNGKRYRLSTGKSADKRLLRWYENNAESEFFKLYEKKYGSISSPHITFREYGREIVEITKQNRNSFSQKEELQRFEKLCETFGEKCIKDIKSSDILKWQNGCGFKRKTILNYRSTLNNIFHMAYMDELINRNPLQGVKPPLDTVHDRSSEVKVFTEEEINKLLENASERFKNMLLFNFATGLRGSELIALKWEHIDFEEKKIHVLERIREGTVDIPKQGSIRTIDMLPRAYEALKKQWLVTGDKSEYVFVTQYGSPYKTPDTLTVQLRKLCRECNISIGTLHDTRKTCNTLLKQNELQPDWILHQLGHSEEKVNRKHYTGPIEANKEKIGRVLAGCSL